MREKDNGYVYETFADFSLNDGEHIGYGLEEWMTDADNVARWERPEWLTYALRKASAITCNTL